MRFEVDGGHGAADLIAPVPLGQLIHVAATLDDPTGAMNLYLNGAVVAQQTIRLYLLHPATRQRLNGLPPLERRLLELVYVDRLTDSEVATLLGIPAGEVQARAIQALHAV